jgi:hypothetical protein
MRLLLTLLIITCLMVSSCAAPTLSQLQRKAARAQNRRYYAPHTYKHHSRP